MKGVISIVKSEFNTICQNLQDGVHFYSMVAQQEDLEELSNEQADFLKQLPEKISDNNLTLRSTRQSRSIS